MNTNKKNKIVVVIPAKAESGRLPNKNMCILENGKPLLSYTIEIAKKSPLVQGIYVSTDSAEIADFAKKEGAGVIMRPEELLGEAPIVEVYKHAISEIGEDKASYVVGLQPDHPDRVADIDEVIQFALDKNLDDLISVDSKGIKNGSIRIMNSRALIEGRISVNAGSVMDNATNIHTASDLRMARARVKNNLSIKIKDKVIAHDSSTFVIAEAACNHMCDIELAKKMIDEAETSGADAIKFQTYKAEKLVAKDAKTYWNYGKTKSQYEYYKQLDKFDKEEYKVLFDYAKDKDIVVFSSPFDEESSDMLNELGMPLFKIASCLMPNKQLIKHIAGYKKPIILSCGGSAVEEIQEVVDAIYEQGNFLLILMACTLSYPAKNEDANLGRIQGLQQLFPHAIVGYSDHTEPDENMVIPSIALSHGAKVIEKHFTLDRTMEGSGHSFSVDPASLKKMVDNIRLTEIVMGSSEMGVLEAEKKTIESARMSIVARYDIKKDEILKEDMLMTIRPGTGILPKFMDEVVNKKAKRDIKTNEQLDWNDIG